MAPNARRLIRQVILAGIVGVGSAIALLTLSVVAGRRHDVLWT
jgi:hypothetical protein